MSSTIAVAHYPEGAGHATRMLAIADALEAAGADIRMAGGGAGTQFVELNGYDEFEPATVDYIDAYQQGSLREVLTRSVPASVDRLADYAAWFGTQDVDAVVTDDMFAAIAASRTDVPLYVLKHDAPALYADPIERSGALFHTWFQLSVTREFFYPAVWPPSAADPDGATRVGPVALDDDGRTVDAADVVVVPSYYSEFDDVTARLDRAGYDVLNVGGDDWAPVASLLPYVRGADLVVCSGYSTIMDASVAGTPCAIVPETTEQEAVAEWIEQSETSGFVTADTAADVLGVAADPPDPPEFENGAEKIAATILDDLAEPPSASAHPSTSTPQSPQTATTTATQTATETQTPDASSAPASASEPDSSAVSGTSETDADISSGPAGVSTAVATMIGVAATATSASVSGAFGRSRAPTTPTRSAIAWSLLVGRPNRAAATSVTALLLGVLVAREVAVGDAYKLLEQLYPTFSGEVHALLIVTALALVSLSALGSLSGAGAVPSVLLTSAPVLGWAVNYWIGPISPGSAVGFPFQNVLLYGVACGVAGYLLGIRLRPLLATGDRRSGIRAG